LFPTLQNLDKLLEDAAKEGDAKIERLLPPYPGREREEEEKENEEEEASRRLMAKAAALDASLEKLKAEVDTEGPNKEISDIMAKDESVMRGSITPLESVKGDPGVPGVAADGVTGEAFVMAKAKPPRGEEEEEEEELAAANRGNGTPESISDAISNHSSLKLILDLILVVAWKGGSSHAS